MVRLQLRDKTRVSRIRGIQDKDKVNSVTFTIGMSSATKIWNQFVRIIRIGTSITYKKGAWAIRI